MATAAKRVRRYRDRKRRGVLAVVSVEITPEIRRGFDACAMFETPEGGKVSNENYAMAAQIFLDGTMKDLLDGIED